MLGRTLDFVPKINSGGTHAMLIGISDIGDSYQMPEAVKVVEEMKNFLISPNIGISENNIKTLINPSKSEVIATLEKISEVEKMDNFFFYYVGESMIGNGQSLYLYCRDYKRKTKFDPFYNLSLQDLKQAFRDIDTNIVLILDCILTKEAFEQFYHPKMFFLANRAVGTERLDYYGETFLGRDILNTVKALLNQNDGTVFLYDIYAEIFKHKYSKGTPVLPHLISTGTVSNISLSSLNNSRQNDVPFNNSEKNDLKTKLKNFIQDEKINLFMEEVEKLDTYSHYEDEIRLMFSRYNFLKSKVNVGAISFQEEITIQNQIMQSFFSIIPKLFDTEVNPVQ